MIKLNKNFKKNLLTITLIISLMSLLRITQVNTALNLYVKYLTLSLSLLHALLYVYQNRNKRSVILWIMEFAILFCAYRYSEGREVLDLFIYVSYYKDLDYDDINDIYLEVLSKGFIIVLILGIMNILPSAPLKFRDGYIRYSFGFTHANSAGYAMYLLVTALFISKYRTRKTKYIIYLLGISIFSFYFFNSRTSFYMSLILLAVYTMNRIGIAPFKNLIKLRVVKVAILFLAVCVFFGLIYVSLNISKFDELNTYFSGRLDNNLLFLESYKIQFWGNSNVSDMIIGNDGWSLRYLDSGYFQCLLKLGILNTIVYLLLLFKALRRALNDKRVEIIMVLITLAFILITEAMPLRWFCALPILYYNNKKIVEGR